MKRVFLLMAISALLVTLGFAQTPDPGSNTDPASIKGCLGGSDGNYTVAEDGTSQIFKITTSSVDLKPHVGHEVKLAGHKASGAAGAGAAENSFTVTELSMIAEHCAVAAAAAPSTVPAPAVDPGTPATAVSPSPEPVIAPAADAATPAATATPSAETVVAPVAPVAPAAAVIAPAVETAAPVAPAPEPVIAPAAKAAQPARPSGHPRKPAASAAVPVETVSPSPETVVPPVADATATAPPPSETAGTPDAAAAVTPAAPVATQGSGLRWLLISAVILIIALGTVFPLIGRWRKRKALENAPNLSFNKEASSDRNEPEPRKVA